MISYIRGELTEVLSDAIVVEAGGVGFEINVPNTVFGSLPRIGEEVKIYTYFRVSEDAMSLYGFCRRSDLEMFRQLLGVSGIGPKGALAILSALTPDDLRMAIVASDAKAIARAPGVGAKTAQRVIIDLKDKVSIEDVLGAPASAVSSVPAAARETGASGDAIEALMALGYGATEAARAVRGVEGADEMDSEQILKAALRRLF